VSWQAIQALAQVQAQAGVASPERLQLLAQPPAASEQGGFGGMVSEALGQVNQKLLASQTDLQQLAVGNVQNLHQVMIRLEESQLSFQLLLQVRNRVLEAYQDILKMQV
jgi:flagellar hook-basal body complex protein FliE